MDFFELLKVLFLGIIEGITEWIPISSTGHMILVDEFIKLNVTPEFKEMFFVVIQLGAILAVVVLYFKRLIPFSLESGGFQWRRDTISMWGKILIASIPAGVVGLLFDDWFNAWFYNYQTVAVMLILFGVLFIIVEKMNRGKKSHITSIGQINYMTALMIGVFQLIAAVFPGTSRSGATIVGALLLGVSRTVSAEFTFFLAIPAMLGASAYKLLKFGFTFTGTEAIILLVGMLTAFLVSIVVIRFLMTYIKKHDFAAFGWYRIILGVAVIGYFLFQSFVK